MDPQEILDELQKRLEKADRTLAFIASQSHLIEDTEVRLTAKAEGVRLALRYLRELRSQ